MAGKAPEDAHRQIGARAQSAVPRLGADYFFLAREMEEESQSLLEHVLSENRQYEFSSCTEG